MQTKEKDTNRKDPSFAPLMRSMALELAIYSPLVTIYFLLFLRYLKEPFTILFQQNPPVYAFASALAIVLQGVLLERLTSWLLRRVGLRQ